MMSRPGPDSIIKHTDQLIVFECQLTINFNWLFQFRPLMSKIAPFEIITKASFQNALHSVTKSQNEWNNDSVLLYMQLNQLRKCEGSSSLVLISNGTHDDTDAVPPDWQVRRGSSELPWYVLVDKGFGWKDIVGTGIDGLLTGAACW